MNWTASLVHISVHACYIKDKAGGKDIEGARKTGKWTERQTDKNRKTHRKIDKQIQIDRWKDRENQAKTAKIQCSMFQV